MKKAFHLFLKKEIIPSTKENTSCQADGHADPGNGCVAITWEGFAPPLEPGDLKAL